MSLFKPDQGPKRDNIEPLIQDVNQRIEELKVQFNLFFTGEIRVPPERDRELLEKKIRNMMLSTHKSPRTALLIQNMSSRFSLYNNMWMKRLNEIETGITVIKRKKTAYTEEPKPPPPPPKVKEKPKTQTVSVSLNSEESFDKFFNDYSRLAAKTPMDKDAVINKIKTKLITANLIDAKVNLTVAKGKVKVKIKGEQ